MNREIKFRAWDESRKEMIREFGLLKENMPQLLQNEEDGYIFCGHLQDNGDWIEPILMQFTGLHDKNGKDIYEGDIIKHPLATEPEEKGFICKWGFIGWCFLNVNFPNDYEYAALMFNDYNKSCEIIGNIYENPELL